MRRLIAMASPLAATIALLMVPSVASADSTSTIYGTCNLTAYTPLYGGSSNMVFDEAVDCSGTNYSKRDYVCDWQLVSSGWQIIPGTQCASNGNPWDGWTINNPDGETSTASCVSGRWYATTAAGEVNVSGTIHEASANTFNSGNQCP